jgi:hypothetical protein
MSSPIGTMMLAFHQISLRLRLFKFFYFTYHCNLFYSNFYVCKVYLITCSYVALTGRHANVMIFSDMAQTYWKGSWRHSPCGMWPHVREEDGGGGSGGAQSVDQRGTFFLLG